MRFCLSWLNSYFKYPLKCDIVVEKLTNLGLEVEEVIDHSKIYEGFILGQIKSYKKHPNADRLNLCKVDVGSNELIDVVCGASNVRDNMKVAFARPGVIIPSTKTPLKIGKIRDVHSYGMMCSEKELNLGNEHEGIMDIKTDHPLGTPIAKVLNLDDPIIDISITPNRGDCFSILGIARDLAASGISELNEKIDKYEFDLKFKKEKIDIKTKKCSQFIGLWINNVENVESPESIQKRLKSAGLNPINLLVDVTNYMALDLGQPMHVYDADKVKNHLIVRESKKGEKFKTLDDEDIILNDAEIVISDDEKVLGLAGIMGGVDSGVTQDTKNIILEAATFDQISIAESGQSHNILSNSRTRFERGVDPNITIKAMEKAVSLIKKYAKGKIIKQSINLSDFKNKEITFEFDFMKKRTGVELEFQDITKYLRKLGFEILEITEINIRLIPPSWRFDILTKEDITEELLRLYSYENLKAISLPIKKPTHVEFKYPQMLFHMECFTFSFISEKKAQLFGGENSPKIDNPISIEHKVMRPSIIPSLLDVAVYNINHGQERGKFYEISKVFKDDKEVLMVASVSYGNVDERSWHQKERVGNFYDSKTAFLAVLSQYKITKDKMQISRDTPSYYHPSQSACYKQGKRILGYSGEINPKVLKYFGINKSCISIEIFLENIPLITEKIKPYKQLLYPSIKRDLSFIVDKNISSKYIVDVVKKTVKEVIIFDVYEGDKIEKGKKAIGFQFSIDQKEHTLNDDEINNVMNEIIKNVEKECSATLRNQ